MKKIAYIFLLAFSIIGLQGCEEDYLPPALEYVTFGKAVYSTGIDIGGTVSVEIPVYSGNISGSDRTFNLTINSTNAAAGSFTVPSSVTIPGGSNEGTLTVSLSDTNLGIGISNLTIAFEPLAPYTFGTSTSVQYSQNCTEITATLDFVFDVYAEETGWLITDALGGTVVSKPAGSYARNQAPVSETIQLCAGRDYTLIVTDAYADGMNDGTNLGSYTLTIGGDVKVTGGGSFGESESNDFDTN